MWPIFYSATASTVGSRRQCGDQEELVSTTQEIALTQLSAVFAEDWDHLEALYDPEVHYLDPDGEIIGRSAVTDRMRALVAALPNCTHSVRHCTPSEDTVVVEWTLTGDGVRLDVATAYETRNGQILAERNYWDNAALAAPEDGDR
jgi:ketosteroid isomerase-like protein